MCGLDGLTYGVWFTFSPDADSNIKVEISEPSFSIDFGVQEFLSDGRAKCIGRKAFGVFLSTDVEDISFDSFAGRTYSVLVSGRVASRSGTFRISVRVSDFEYRGF